MAKLNQILAVEKGVKTRVYAELTEADKTLQKAQLLSGLSRVYQPKEDEGEQLPPESTLVQVRTDEILGSVRKQLNDLWDTTAIKEWSNCDARSDVTLPDGTVLLSDVPVTYLLFLEKQLTDIRTLVARLPILDPAQKWEFDENTNAFKSETVQTHRTKKVPRVLVKYDATPEHPAQTDVFNEDVIVGFWSTTHFSGAIPAQRRTEMVARVEAVQRAVKIAREAANDLNVTDHPVAETVLDYVFS